MTMQEVEAACKRINDEQRPTKKPTPAAKAKLENPKSRSILGTDNTGNEVASRLSQILDGVDPKTAGEKEKDEIFQNIIGYRQIARSIARGTTRCPGQKDSGLQ